MHFWISTYFDYQVILKPFKTISNPYLNWLKTLGCPMCIIKFCSYWFLPMLTLHHVANPDRLKAWEDWKVAAQLLWRQRSLCVTVQTSKSHQKTRLRKRSKTHGADPKVLLVGRCWKMFSWFFFGHDAGKRSQQTFCFETSRWKCGRGHE